MNRISLLLALTIAGLCACATVAEERPPVPNDPCDKHWVWVPDKHAPRGIVHPAHWACE